MTLISISDLDEYASANALPTIPAVTRDREGLPVALRDNSIRLNLTLLGDAWPGMNTCIQIAYAVRRWLIYRIETCASGTLVRDLDVLHAFLSWGDWRLREGYKTPANKLRSNLAVQIQEHLDEVRLRDATNGSKKLEATVERLRGFYIWCLNNSIPGYDEKGASLLRAIKAPGRKNGIHVMSWDPSKGPLTRVEELQFRKALLEDAGPLNERVACWLTYGMGLRPKQVILLLESDLHTFVASNGERFYQLDVPRVKKKGLADRSAMKRRKIGSQLGKLIEDLIFENRDIKTEPGVNRSLILRRVAVEQRLLTEERVWANRMLEDFVSDSLESLVDRAGLISVRTEKTMKATPRRLRYTFATNKAEYCTPAELAELLDHSDERSVLVYYNSRESIAQEIGAKLSQSSRRGGYRSVLDALAGIPIRVESGTLARRVHGDAMTRFVPPEMVKPEMAEIPGLGSCGDNYSCGSVPVVACYACKEFNAWKEADHGAFADWLGGEIERLRHHGHAAESTLAEFEIAYLRASKLRRDLRRIRVKKR